MNACKNRDTFPSKFFNQPWIIQCHGRNKPTTTFIDPLVTNVEEKEITEIKGKLCMGCINEWLLLWDDESKECFFLDLNSLVKVHLPRLPRESDMIITTFSLSSSPDDPSCIIIFTGAKLDVETYIIADCFIMCCQLHDEKWTKVNLDVDNQNISGATSVVLYGELYLYSVDHLIIFDISSLLIGQLETRTVAGPKVALQPQTDMISVHLIKSCENIYLVRVYSYGMGPISNMDIYQLDLTSNEWSRVCSIGTYAFFLSNMCYASVCALDAGVSSNCIYYAPFCITEDRWRIYKFCLDDHTMTFSLSSIIQTNYKSRICWFVPKRSHGVITDSSVLSTIVLNEASHHEVTEERIANNISGSWDDLPFHLLETFVPHVSLVDAVRLSAVCKTWNFISNSISRAKTWPWLIYQVKLDGTFKLLDPLNGKEYSINIGTPSSNFNTQMLSSKDGWIVMLCDNQTLLMVNPMSKDVVKPPALEDIGQGFHGITFTSVPTSPDCVVMGVCTDRRYNSIEFHVWHVGEEEWTVIYNDEIPFSIASTNPVFLDGDLYCLGELGELGVFNPVEITWKMLEKPEPLYLEEDDNAPFRGTEDCFLLELGGELVSVFKYNYSDYEIRIFKLDRLKMQWTQVEDIPDWTIFLDQKSSFARPSPHKSWSNKVLFTTIHSGTIKTCAAYCMKNKRYEVNFCDTMKPLDCAWLEPNLISKKNLNMNSSKR